MNWDALGAIGEVTGSIAVVVTLVYVVLQVRYLKRQAIASSLQQVTESWSSFEDLIASSADVASIVRRGRESYGSLSPDEKLRFDSVYRKILNSVESWQTLIIHVMDPSPLRDDWLRNIDEVVRLFCRHPGVVEFWRSQEQGYNAEIRKVVEAAIADI